MKIKKHKKYNLTNIGRTYINKLMDKQIVKEYKECCQNIIINKQTVMDDSVLKIWEHINEGISEVASNVLGKRKP